MLLMLLLMLSLVTNVSGAAVKSFIGLGEGNRVAFVRMMLDDIKSTTQLLQTCNTGSAKRCTEYKVSVELKIKKLQDYLDSYPLEGPIGEKGSMIPISTGLLFSSSVKASRARQWIEETYQNSGKLAGKFDEIKAKLGYNTVDAEVKERLNFEAKMNRDEDTEKAGEDNLFGMLAVGGGVALILCTLIYYCLAGPSAGVFVSLALGVLAVGGGAYLLRSSIFLKAARKGSAIASRKHKGIIIKH